MSANHLIIGLGGTGGKVIRAFRKAVYQQYRDLKPPKVRLGYLYVDSSKEMMDIGDPSWAILGTSVQLGKSEQVLITEANLASRLDNISNYPGIKPWIGDRAAWRDILSSIVGAALGGQKRRLGRFLLACNVDNFLEQLQNQVRELQTEGSTAVTFHVCVGLAGGTGSGTLIDTVAQIRDKYPDPKQFRVILYALLPDTYPPPNWNTGNYHANGYACLMQLNAMSVGNYSPSDITGRKKAFTLTEPFNGCYLFTNENENGLSVDVNKDVPHIVADFLYQKLIAVTDIAWDALARMENAENGDG